MRSDQSIRLSRRWCVAAVAAFSAAAVLTSCSSGAGSGAPNAAGTRAVPTTGPAKAAAALTKKYTDSPTPFPVTTPLPKSLPAGTKFGYLQCVSVPCAQLGELFQSAARAIGGRLVIAKAGASAAELQGALSSLIEQHPAAIFLPSVEPSTYAPQLRAAKRTGIKLVATGVMDPQSAGIDAVSFGRPVAELAGKLQADWVSTRAGSNTHVVFYGTSELSFLAPEQAAFKTELSSVCPTCSVRTVNIPIATYGNGAAGQVASDLQSHPDTRFAVFGAAAAATGLPAALRTAGLKVPYIGYSLTPSNLQDIKAGTQEAGLGLDNQVLAWQMTDEAARLVLGAPLVPAEQQQLATVQWVTAQNLRGDLSKPWTAYPDVAARFRKVWHPA